MNWVIEACWVVALLAAIAGAEQPYKRSVAALPPPARGRHHRFWAGTRPPVLALSVVGFLAFRFLGYHLATVGGAILAVVSAFVFFRRRLKGLRPTPERSTVRGYDASAILATAAIAIYLVRALT